MAHDRFRRTIRREVIGTGQDSAEPLSLERDRISLVPAEWDVRTSMDQGLGVICRTPVGVCERPRRKATTQSSRLRHFHTRDSGRRKVERQPLVPASRRRERDRVGMKDRFTTAERHRCRSLDPVPAGVQHRDDTFGGSELHEVTDPTDVTAFHDGDSGAPVLERLLGTHLSGHERGDMAETPVPSNPAGDWKIDVDGGSRPRINPALSNGMHIPRHVDDAMRVDSHQAGPSRCSATMVAFFGDAPSASKMPAMKSWNAAASIRRDRVSLGSSTLAALNDGTAPGLRRTRVGRTGVIEGTPPLPPRLPVLAPRVRPRSRGNGDDAVRIAVE